MLTAQRKQLILNELDATGRVVASQLALRFDLSEDTIRRDLRQMAADGLCQRVYGGAVAPSAGTLDQRHLHLQTEKTRLARQAVTLVRTGQTILIDAGSTNSAIARMLPADLGLTVVTNAPDIVGILASRRDIQLIVLGGVYDAGIGACLGPQTIAGIADLHADWLFLGSCGLDPKIGVTAFDQGEALVKRAMAAVSDRIAVAVTTEKLGTAAPHRVIATADIDTLVAEDSPALAAYGSQGVRVSTP